jgi:hyperosmotically inducible protein
VRRHLVSAAAILVVVALSAVQASAGGQEHAPLGDAQITERVLHRLSEKHIARVDVTVAGGVVTLRGTVPSLWAKNEAIAQARKTEDVHSVRSEITIARGESDARIGEQIADRLRRYVFYTIYDDVEIAVDKGVVALTGRVTMPYKAEALAELASRITGVQEIRNSIQALPASTFDDQLRYAIARQIYGDPLFWNYAIQVTPPIHIVVEHGRVTLAGVVLSEIERRKAESIASLTFGVMSVDNKLRLERGK